MGNFSIKDLLIHILHGMVILCAIIIAFDISPAITAFNKKISESGLSITFDATVMFVVCYLLGLFLDVIADFIDTRLIKYARRFPFLPYYPSYYLLQNGERWHIRLAHYVKIREKLCQAAINNDETIKNGKYKEEIWKCNESIMLLYNYAKNRAFANASPYQTERIAFFWGLFIFYRNMMTTTLICIFLFFLSFCIGNISACMMSHIILVTIILIPLFFLASYKYRIYYCRIVLGAAYNPEKEGTNN